MPIENEQQRGDMAVVVELFGNDGAVYITTPLRTRPSRAFILDGDSCAQRADMRRRTKKTK
jgi:hypothetical protein